MSSEERAPLLAPTAFSDERFRRRLPPMAMTKGVYDLTHLGHVESLWNAKRHGGCLVVAVADDDSVLARKGAGRPILSFRERVGILSSLRMVDYLVPYSGSSPFDVVAAVRPACFCASHFDSLAAHEIGQLTDLGVQLIEIPKPAERSTTEIILSIRGE